VVSTLVGRQQYACRVAYRVAADVVLTVHVAIVAFVILGLLLTLLGGALRWSWVRNRWFRGGHLATIAVIVVQSWFGVICFLTDWEMGLRRRGGQATYDESFIGYWLGRLLFIEGVPGWVFMVVYTAFGALVLASLWLVPVRWRTRAEAHG
jgi:hypothetical protein